MPSSFVVIKTIKAQNPPVRKITAVNAQWRSLRGKKARNVRTRHS